MTCVCHLCFACKWICWLRILKCISSFTLRVTLMKALLLHLMSSSDVLSSSPWNLSCCHCCQTVSSSHRFKFCPDTHFIWKQWSTHRDVEGRDCSEAFRRKMENVWLRKSSFISWRQNILLTYLVLMHFCFKYLLFTSQEAYIQPESEMHITWNLIKEDSLSYGFCWSSKITMIKEMIKEDMRGKSISPT